MVYKYFLYTVYQSYFKVYTSFFKIKFINLINFIYSPPVTLPGEVLGPVMQRLEADEQCREEEESEALVMEKLPYMSAGAEKSITCIHFITIDI